MQIVAPRPAGFGRVFGALLASLTTLGAVFLTGALAGVLIVAVVGLWLGATNLEETVVTTTYRAGGASRIAILPVSGVIDASDAEFTRVCVDDILADRSVKAVVLRVDSPGGGVAASDRIWYQVTRLKNAGLPVVASYGGVAASGGYYVSCGSDFIMAETTCITGSIGVMAQLMTFEGLMDKVGVQPVTLVATGSPRKTIANDLMRTWDEADRDEVVGMLDAAYEVFHTRVWDGRRAAIPTEGQVDALADGSIFTAAEAVKNGLIDAIGYLDDAITKAEQMAGLGAGSATVTMLRPRPTFFGGMPLVRGPGGSALDVLDAERVRTLVDDLTGVRIMYLLRWR